MKTLHWIGAYFGTAAIIALLVIASPTARAGDTPTCAPSIKLALDMIVALSDDFSVDFRKASKSLIDASPGCADEYPDFVIREDFVIRGGLDRSDRTGASNASVFVSHDLDDDTPVRRQVRYDGGLASIIRWLDTPPGG